MSRSAIGAFLVGTGLLTALVFALADATGVGRYEGFGPDQVKGTIAGAVIFAAGLVSLVASRRLRGSKP